MDRADQLLEDGDWQGAAPCRSHLSQASPAPECQPARVDGKGPRVDPHEFKRDPLFAVFVAPVHTATDTDGASGGFHGGVSGGDVRLAQPLRECHTLTRAGVGFRPIHRIHQTEPCFHRQ